MSTKEQIILPEKQNRLIYIDGLKGIACIMIMVGHFTGIVRYSSNITCFPFISWLEESIFSTFVDEGFWLQLFFVISGFLLSYTKIDKVTELIRRVIKRFLRFYLPILAACILIYILSAMVGFHNRETASIFTCAWFYNYYSSKITLLDLVKDPINTVLFGESKFNGPYWVIRSMYLSSVLVYLISFLTSLIKNNKVFLIIIYVFTIIIAGLTLNSIFSGCLTGALCGILVKDFGKQINRMPQTFNTIVCLLWLILPFGLHDILFYVVEIVLDLAGLEVEKFNLSGFSDSTWAVLYFAVLIIILSGTKLIQGALSCKVLSGLNKISFGIYSFHWPLICSIGALLMLRFPVKKGIILGWIICIILTIVIAIFYHIVFENNINKLLKKLEKIR